jgi:hypothetical protein
LLAFSAEAASLPIPQGAAEAVAEIVGQVEVAVVESGDLPFPLDADGEPDYKFTGSQKVPDSFDGGPFFLT